MIQRLRVTGLNGRSDFDLEFFPDINVFTGKNGSGKTTVLKLLWYMMSGNLERIPGEISFKSAELVADKFSVSVFAAEDGAYEWSVTTAREPLAQTYRGNPEAGARALNILNGHVIEVSGESYFFPTFRRIEGGFSIGEVDSPRARYERGGRMIEAFAELADRISVGRHRIVISVSTSDIVRLFTDKYAEVSEQINADSRSLSSAIMQQTSEYERIKASPISDHTKLSDATTILERIQALVSDYSRRRDALLRRFTGLGIVAADIFRDKRIRLTPTTMLGAGKEAVDSNKLSSGEKQMLSFLAYNGFTEKAALFIDEPELSLHADWQRILFPVLLSQGAENQFFVATHSPFIYSKYSDRELPLMVRQGEG
jgi:predicted ATP-dependent endonuclease of OLD family